MSIFENKEVEKMQEYRMTQITKADIVPTALRMRHEGRWLVMIHGQVEPDGQVRVSYDYAVDPAVESYYVLGETTLPSNLGTSTTRRARAGRRLHELMGLNSRGSTRRNGCFCRRICSRPRARATSWSRRSRSSGEARGANGEGSEDA